MSQPEASGPKPAPVTSPAPASTEPPAPPPAGAEPPPPAGAKPPPPAPASTEPPPSADRLLLLSVLAVATCGLVYELISATMASYLLGDSVTQWSLVIGVYLSAMGLGSYLSKFVERDLYGRFVVIQLGIALVGGMSAGLLFIGFAHLATVRPLLFGILILVGTMVGLEIPLLLRILQKGQPLKDVVARVLAFDYLGSLAASILFPLLLLPYLGLVRTALLFGLINAVIALWFVHRFAAHIQRLWVRRTATWATFASLAVGMAGAGRIEHFGEAELYDAPVVYSTRTPYQRLSVTRWHDDVRLYIDGNLQFSSLDEYRYHEALVHTPLAVIPPGATGLHALVLGGGDGLAAHQLLLDGRVARVDLVDLDPGMTELFASHPVLAGLNGGSLADARVQVHNTDAMEWLGARSEAGGAPFDLAIVDLPDPNNFSLGKLYTRAFYRLLASQVAPGAPLVVQATSPYQSPQAFWCIVRTLESAGLTVQPYHVHVPSFGDWGFALASSTPLQPPKRLHPGVPRRFLTDEILPSLFVFPGDQAPLAVGVNHLNDQLLVHYYESDLQRPRRGG